MSKNKYKVIDRETGEEVIGVFVLDPADDPIAVASIQRYAELTPDEDLAVELNSWMESIEMLGLDMPPKCDYCGDVAKVKPSPYIGDTFRKMCKKCWNDTRKEYKNAHGEDIGEF